MFFYFGSAFIFFHIEYFIDIVQYYGQSGIAYITDIGEPDNQFLAFFLWTIDITAFTWGTILWCCNKQAFLRLSK